MEIFQTIWNALTTENTVLVNIISIPLAFIEAYISMLIFTSILNIKGSITEKLVYSIIFSILSLTNMFFIPMPYYTFINVLIMPVLVFFIFKTTILKAVLSEIITYSLFIVVSAILMLIYSSSFKISSNIIMNIPIHKLYFSILQYVILYLFYKLYTKSNIKIYLLDKFKAKNSLLLSLNFIIGSIALGIEFYLLFNYIDFIPTFLVFTSLFVLLIYFGISMFSLIRTNKLEITTQNLEEQKMYNKTLSTLHDNIRGFKHDFDNIVQAIGGYLSTNNIEGLKIYYEDVLGDCQTNNNLAVLNPELINNPAIYSLLADKYYKAEELGIKMNIEVMMDLSNLNIKIYELSRILGVLFDNAVEAASKCDKRIVNITFRKDKNRNKDLIIIQNTYANKDIDVNRIFEKGFSSKDENAKEHGLGLWEVKRYLKKNSHLDLFTTKTDEFFTQQFEIYYE